MKAYTHVIWDFNGTILNDVQVGILCANRLLRAHGLPEIPSVEAYREKFGFPIVDYYRRLGFDFDILPYADLAVEWVAYYLECKKDAVIFEDIPATLQKLKEKGIPQLILSATEVSMLEGQVRDLGIREYFDTLLGLENIQAYSKEEIGRRWIGEHSEARLNPITVEATDRVLGAQLSVWECTFEEEIGRAIENLSALSERTWTVKRLWTFEEFNERAVQTILRICRFIQDKARALGYEWIFAISQSAVAYFRDRLGYEPLPRSVLPASRRAVLEASGRASEVFGHHLS